MKTVFRGMSRSEADRFVAKHSAEPISIPGIPGWLAVWTRHDYTFEVIDRVSIRVYRNRSAFDAHRIEGDDSGLTEIRETMVT
jgi:hypothetical protein